MTSRPQPIQRPAERRQITLLFCDLVNSTALAEQLDPEELLELIEAYYTVCDDIISCHSGYLGQYLGDGVLAYFGYPDACEEAAPNAVRAGLRLQESIQGIASPTGGGLSCRIGIATGAVVVNTIRNLDQPRQAGLMLGETPNLAARLQSLAAPGQILVSERTYRITAGLFDHQSLGLKALKGFQKPVPIYAVAGETGVACRSQARLNTSHLPLIGRQQEMAMLLGSWQQVQQGRGQLVLIQGEAGIGKSRLAGELRQSLMGQGHRQMSWYCGPSTRESSLHPIAEQIRKAAGFEKGEADQIRHDKLATLLERYGATEARSLEVLADLLGLGGAHPSAPSPLTPEKRRQIRLETLLGMIQTWSNGEPGLIVVEDLHWIDPSTLELLERLIAITPHQPWMVVATARPEFTAAWASDGTCLPLQLQRLDRAASELICSSLNDEAALSPQLTRGIVERCDGIPLFVEETTKSMLELLRTKGSLGGDGVEQIPETLQDSLVSRLDRLGEARRLASLGATIGRSFTYELLEAVSTQPEAMLRQQMEQLLSSGLVLTSDQTAGEAYEFKHALIRDAAYETMLKRERQILHERIAQTLSRQFHELVEAEPELLAYHFTRAGAFAAAVPHWLQAGRRAAAMASHEEAVQHFQSGLEVLDKKEDRQEQRPDVLELPLLLSLATSMAAARSYSEPEVGRLLQKARSLADHLNDSQAAFSILRGICNFAIVSCDLGSAEASAEECLQLWEAGNDPIHGIEAHFAIGYVHYVKGRVNLARQHLSESIQLYHHHEGWGLSFPSTHDPMIGSLTALAMVELAAGDPEQVTATLAQSNQHALRLGRNYESVYAWSHELLILVLQGRYLEALKLSDTVVEISDEYGYLTWRAIAKVDRGISMAKSGLAEPEVALALAMEGMGEQERLGVRTLKGFRLAEIATIHALAGAMPEAMATIHEAEDEVNRSGEAYFAPLVQVRKAEILAQAGGSHQPGVLASLEEALALASDQDASNFIEMIRAEKQKHETPRDVKLPR